MNLIKNFNSLATNRLRRTCLKIIEEGLSSIQPDKIVQKNISITNHVLKIIDKQFNLKDFNKVFLLGFGKGSAGISKCIEKRLENVLNQGFVIDVEKEKFTNIKFIQGTHPLPSQTNFLFTKEVLNNLSNLNSTDLMLAVIAGGGSALLEYPYKISLEKLIEVNKDLLKSGANIYEINIVRKHLSKVKGGGLAKILYPAKVVSIIVSDVPGNDLSIIASGPTVKDKSTKEEAFDIFKKYNLWKKLNLSQDDFLETPKEDKYFKNGSNILILSNKTALNAMAQKSRSLGLKVLIYTDSLQGEAKFIGKKLIHKTPPHTVLLAGGETTVKVKDKGMGGRNQEVVLGALPHINDKTVIASLDSDGWDNSSFAGAVADFKTVEKAKKLKLNLQKFLDNNDSFSFFEKVEDGIITGKLPSNVSDLMIVVKN